MAPVQAKILPISDKYNDYAESIVKSLRNKGIRIEADYRAEKIGYKIREARLERVPYILVVGEKEAENNAVAVRSLSLIHILVVLKFHMSMDYLAILMLMCYCTL